MARMKSSGLLKAVSISFFVTVTLSSPARPSLHLDEAQPSGAGHPALDVVAELLELAIHRLESQIALNLHDDGPRPRRGCLGVR